MLFQREDFPITQHQITSQVYMLNIFKSHYTLQSLYMPFDTSTKMPNFNSSSFFYFLDVAGGAPRGSNMQGKV